MITTDSDYLEESIQNEYIDEKIKTIPEEKSNINDQYRNKSRASGSHERPKLNRKPSIHELGNLTYGEDDFPSIPSSSQLKNLYGSESESRKSSFSTKEVHVQEELVDYQDYYEDECKKQEKEAERRRKLCCLQLIDPFKLYFKTESIQQLDTNAKHGVMKQKLPILTVEDVVVHNKEDDCWVIIHGVVRDLTKLIQDCKANGQYNLVKPLIANAGKDISVWFDEVTRDILYHVHPITGVYVPYIPNGRLPHVGLEVPSSDWSDHCQTIPWWYDSRNVVAMMTKKSRTIRIMNMICSVVIKMTVCSEDTINTIQDKYLKKYNSHAKSYTWKFDKRLLKMNLTLDENGIKDESKLFTSCGMPEDSYIPCLMVYFNDDLTES